MEIDRSFIDSFVKVTSRAAYGASKLKGKNDKIAAGQAAVDEMRTELNKIDMKGIIVIGEKPYAEGMGDNETLKLSKDDLIVLENMKSENIPLVVIMLSGRPLMITEELDNWDAFVAAWLPGTEGDGISDVLFGDYTPTGKLSFSWPRDISQIPSNYTDENYNPLFKFNYGLTY